MALFSGFNLGGVINNATNAFNQVSGTISNFSSALNNSPFVRTVNKVSNVVNNVRGATSAIDNLVNGSVTNISGFGTATRMVSNAIQGVTAGANPSNKTFTPATSANPVSKRIGESSSGEWRVRLEVPSQIASSPVLKPLVTTGNNMVFPFNPVIIFSQSADYNEISPTHTNYAFHAYQGSKVDSMQITGEFYTENEDDGRYWIACVHFLRTMTKMFYGNGDNLGNPPMVSRLNGYGDHVLNDIPVLITNFTVDLPADVDYISCLVPKEGGKENYVPTQSQISVTVVPNYARSAHSQFNLTDFANGVYAGSGKGFI